LFSNTPSLHFSLRLAHEVSRPRVVSYGVCKLMLRCNPPLLIVKCTRNAMMRAVIKHAASGSRAQKRCFILDYGSVYLSSGFTPLSIFTVICRKVPPTSHNASHLSPTNSPTHARDNIGLHCPKIQNSRDDLSGIQKSSIFRDITPCSPLKVN
jgi:hypothetical protein